MKPGMLMYEDVGSASYQDENGNWHDGAPDGIIDDVITSYSIHYTKLYEPCWFGCHCGFNFWR